ncbi:MAG: hybrid sensor histidine kinase/response regulator [Taibaiella sp.]|nr:hybrid sensor histidine kinase/response regulator [Taibaiella sp.]
MNKEKALVIVEDKGTRNAIKILLELNGVDVVSTDGAAQAARRCNTEQFDIILCDMVVAMPEGNDILRVFKDSARHYKTPFLVLSQSADEKDYREARNLGANDFIPVPFSGKLLSTTVKAQLELSKRLNRILRSEINDQVFALLNKNFNQELLTPLNGILNVTALIGSIPGVEDIDSLPDLLGVIYASCFRMQRTTHNIRTYSLLNTENKGDAFLTSDNIVLESILSSVIGHYENNITSGLKVIDAEILQVGTWQGKEEYVRNIFTELIDNAVKFTPADQLPLVTLQALNNNFVFSVTNALSENVFFNVNNIAPFKKFHNDLSRNGLGLGLFVVKSICEDAGYHFFMTKKAGSVTFTVECTV